MRRVPNTCRVQSAAGPGVPAAWLPACLPACLRAAVEGGPSFTRDRVLLRKADARKVAMSEAGDAAVDMICQQRHIAKRRIDASSPPICRPYRRRSQGRSQGRRHADLARARAAAAADLIASVTARAAGTTPRRSSASAAAPSQSRKRARPVTCEGALLAEVVVRSLAAKAAALGANATVAQGVGDD